MRWDKKIKLKATPCCCWWMNLVFSKRHCELYRKDRCQWFCEMEIKKNFNEKQKKNIIVIINSKQRKQSMCAMVEQTGAYMSVDYKRIRWTSRIKQNSNNNSSSSKFKWSKIKIARPTSDMNIVYMQIHLCVQRKKREKESGLHIQMPI